MEPNIITNYYCCNSYFVWSKQRVSVQWCSLHNCCNSYFVWSKQQQMYNYKFSEDCCNSYFVWSKQLFLSHTNHQRNCCNSYFVWSKQHGKDFPELQPIVVTLILYGVNNVSYNHCIFV